MIKTIIFATDLGVFTSHMLQHVVSLANCYNARVIAVHAVEPLGGFANAVVKTYLPEANSEALASISIEEVMSSIKSKVKAILNDEFMGEGTIHCIDDIRVVQGAPAAVILQQSKMLRADMIVIGSHGPNAIDNKMLGSVTNKVLLRAKVPVLMVPMINPQKLYSDKIFR